VCVVYMSAASGCPAGRVCVLAASSPSGWCRSAVFSPAPASSDPLQPYASPPDSHTHTHWDQDRMRVCVCQWVCDGSTLSSSSALLCSSLAFSWSDNTTCSGSTLSPEKRFSSSASFLALDNYIRKTLNMQATCRGYQRSLIINRRNVALRGERECQWERLSCNDKA